MLEMNCLACVSCVYVPDPDTSLLPTVALHGARRPAASVRALLAITVESSWRRPEFLQGPPPVWTTVGGLCPQLGVVSRTLQTGREDRVGGRVHLRKQVGKIELGQSTLT